MLAMHCNGLFTREHRNLGSWIHYWFSTQNNAIPTHKTDNFVRNGKRVGPIEGYSSQTVDEAIRWLNEEDKLGPSS